MASEQDLAIEPQRPTRWNDFTVVASTEHLENMQHLARVNNFEFYSDEPVDLQGGTDKHPYPLHYFTAAIGLCTLTQLVWYSHMMKVPIKTAKCRVTARWTWTGSVLAGTVATNCDQVKTQIEIASDETPDRVAALIQNSEAGCFAQTAIRQPVTIASEVWLNGFIFDYGHFPRKLERR